MEVEGNLKVKEIAIYPIKSLGVVRLDNAKIMEQGLQYDRRWMLVDKNGRFMTIRNRPEFIFFKMSIKPNGFLVSYKSNDLLLPFKPSSNELVSTKIWNDSIQAVKEHHDLNQWFSEMLNEPCTLMYIPESGNRVINPEWGDSQVSLADGYPYLIAGEESLNALNKKLEEPVEMARFRPNIIFDGGEAYEELRWSGFSIGSVNFQGLKPCARCKVITYNLDTAEKGREPLLTLSKQKIDDNIVFGQHTIARSFGQIKIGDNIKVNSYKHSPYDSIETT